MQKGLLLPEQAAVADAATHDLAQHVASSVVRGQHAVVDEKCRSAGVVADDAQRCSGALVRDGGCCNLILAELLAGEFGGAGDERGEEIGLIVREFALQHGGYALKTHAGIDGGLGQRREHAVCRPVELHEDEVPDLDVALVVLAEGQVFPEFGGSDAEVEVDLGAGDRRGRCRPSARSCP